ncbi:hypothetical protein [Photobacterium leiognathi]|uniref:hypothetical protein n=1 Tax=Photobacterium leiognathi TaxID=553611 RepID=UPI0034E94E80
MVSDHSIAKEVVEGCDVEWQALESQARPIVLMRKRNAQCGQDVKLADDRAPNVPYLGVMCCLIRHCIICCLQSLRN